MAEELVERFLQMLAFHDHVNHAVVHQKFGALEGVRQLLFNRLLNHPRAGEADQSPSIATLAVTPPKVGSARMQMNGTRASPN